MGFDFGRLKPFHVKSEMKGRIVFESAAVFAFDNKSKKTQGLKMFYKVDTL